MVYDVRSFCMTNMLAYATFWWWWIWWMVVVAFI